MAMQLGLFEPTLDERFEEWIQTVHGKAVFHEAAARARRLLAQGHKHYGIKAICEVIRYERAEAMGPDAEGYVVNNSDSSRLARRIMAIYPELQGFFETRDLKD